MSEFTFTHHVSARAARAHAQKNCLSVILAAASLVAPALSGVDRQRLERLQHAARRLARLLSDDLDDVPSSASHAQGDIDVEALFIGVCELLHDRAEAAEVTLVVHCAGGTIRGDESDLREALFNLIANGIEATPPRHAVLIVTRVTPEGDQHWSIQDSGIGMSEEILEQIGIPHRTFRRGGSGLGVALAQSIVEEHGGWLRFESRRGRGTTAMVWLPRRAKRRTRHADAPGEARGVA